MPDYFVKGIEDWTKKLNELTPRMQKNVFTSAVNGGASKYIKIARRNLGGGYTTLKKSLKSKKRRSPKGRIKITVYPEQGKGAKNDGWYAHIVEFGSYKKPGGWDIYPWRSKVEREAGERITGKKALAIGANVVYSKVRHPGIKPKRFMSRALLRETEIIQGIVDAGNKAFNNQIKKRWLANHG